MKTYSVRTAFLAILKKFKIQKTLLYHFDELRKFRNRLVHFMKESDITEISSNQKRLKEFKDYFFKQINENQKDK